MRLEGKRCLAGVRLMVFEELIGRMYGSVVRLTMHTLTGSQYFVTCADEHGMGNQDVLYLAQERAANGVRLRLLQKNESTRGQEDCAHNHTSDCMLTGIAKTDGMYR
ncbi:hypothetical protein J1614_002382 [Plenodomus biglobosus]|nr:hypothetical protein J1614_002382 [Plenodomus biglobosus]